MTTQKEITANLETIIIPGSTRSLVQANLVRDINVADGKVELKLSSAALAPGVQEWLADRIKEEVGTLPDVKDVEVAFTDEKPKDVNEIGNIIAIMSGKGGVGKSLVSALTAMALRRQGYEVGILDADITGPSIPKMFGITERPGGSETGILPVSSGTGIQVMSINLLLPNQDDAVIWRGPLIGKAITQFWEETLWGKLDYLIVDLPPGTADAPLTVLQTLPVSGIVIVFTPQELTAMVVRKAVDMAKQMKKNIVGVVENMSYLYVAEIDKKIELFGRSRGEEMAKAAGAPLLGQLPIDPELAVLCDEGKIEGYESKSFSDFAQSALKALSHG
ncbi:MAG: Mrp/NBP35 family ATP-binding protein [Dehalococcoidia bacterium]